MKNKRKESDVQREALFHTLIADLGRDYDPDAALKFLKILESDAQRPTQKNGKAKENLKKLLDNPPEEDTTLHVIYKTPYVLGEIVLSGKKTIQTHPLCKFYPIHFKKTYLQKLSRWETNPVHEATQSHKVWKHFQESGSTDGITNKPSVPLPLGSSPTTFRSQLLDAKSLGSLNPVNSNASPEEIVKQIRSARKSGGSLLPLWHAIESLNECVIALHNGGFLHNDLHKENLLVREGEPPQEASGCIIDFETTEEDPRFQTLEWKGATRNDKRHLIKEACLVLLCANPKEQKQIINHSPLAKEILERLKSDPLFIGLTKELGDSITYSKLTEQDSPHKNVLKEGISEMN
jgi:hypothetical protein